MKLNKPFAHTNKPPEATKAEPNLLTSHLPTSPQSTATGQEELQWTSCSDNEGVSISTSVHDSHSYIR